MIKKGFTLIELLAVILILGIIALIAIPTVNSIIHQAKASAFKETNNGLVQSIENLCNTEMINGNGLSGKYSIVDGEIADLEDLNISGTIPDNGTIIVDTECNVALATSNESYCAIKTLTNDVSVNELGDVCDISYSGAETFTGNNTKDTLFDYTDNGNGTATITGYNGGATLTDYTINSYKITENDYTLDEGDSVKVVIPSTINGLTVTAIGEYAFSMYEYVAGAMTGTMFLDNYIEELYIPSTVTTIGNRAFRSNGITNLVLSQGLTIIGQHAFNSNHIKSLSIPNSVITIETGAFSANNITSLTLGTGLQTIGGSTFGGTVVDTLVIPGGVNSIGTYGFSGSTIKNLILSNGITKVDNSAFLNCKIETLTLPQTLLTISSFAFYQNKIKNLVIPNSVTSVADWSFSVNSLETVTV